LKSGVEPNLQPLEKVEPKQLFPPLEKVEPNVLRNFFEKLCKLTLKKG